MLPLASGNSLFISVVSPDFVNDRWPLLGIDVFVRLSFLLTPEQTSLNTSVLVN